MKENIANILQQALRLSPASRADLAASLLNSIGNKSVSKTKAWVVFLDIYGFSFLVETMESDKLHEELSQCYLEIRELMTTVKYIPHTYFFSDSTFLAYPVHDVQMKETILLQCLTTSRDIMGIFLTHDFPTRGGIAYGDISFSSDLLIGSAVVNAYRYETRLAAPLLVLPYKEIADTTLRKTTYSLHDMIQLKDNTPIFARLLHPFPDEQFIQIVNTNFQKYVIEGGPSDAAKAWLEAKKYIENRKEKDSICPPSSL